MPPNETFPKAMDVVDSDLRPSRPIFEERNSRVVGRGSVRTGWRASSARCRWPPVYSCSPLSPISMVATCEAKLQPKKETEEDKWAHPQRTGKRATRFGRSLSLPLLNGAISSPVHSLPTNNRRLTTDNSYPNTTTTERAGTITCGPHGWSSGSSGLAEWSAPA
jgi:hypothetical protein